MNKKTAKRQLDERQLLNRYKIGNQSLLLLLMLLIFDVIVQDVFGFAWASHMTGTMIFLFIVLAFFSIRCIFADSYFAERDQRHSRFLMFVFVLCGVANSANIMIGAKLGKFSFIQNNHLSDKSLMVFMSLWMLCVPLCYYIKGRLENSKNVREQKEES